MGEDESKTTEDYWKRRVTARNGKAEGNVSYGFSHGGTSGIKIPGRIWEGQRLERRRKLVL